MSHDLTKLRELVSRLPAEIFVNHAMAFPPDVLMVALQCSHDGTHKMLAAHSIVEVLNEARRLCDQGKEGK